MENNHAWLEIRVDTVLVVSLSLRKGHKLQRVWRSLIFQPGGELLLAHSPASPLNYLLCAIRRTHASVSRPFPSLFLLSTSKVSTFPSVSFTYANFLSSHLAAPGRVYLSSFLFCVSSGLCHDIPPALRFVPTLYICYSLHVAIGILLTLACLIRVRLSRKKEKQRPRLYSLPSSCPLPPSNASSYLSPPSQSSFCWIRQC